MDLSNRDALPKDEFAKVKIPYMPYPEPPYDGEAFLEAYKTMDIGETLAAALREDFFQACRYFTDGSLQAHAHWGDDCGDYADAAAEYISILQRNWGINMWHSEPFHDLQIDELNAWLNCADADHCIHQMACDGVDDCLISRLAVDWESCPLSGDNS